MSEICVFQLFNEVQCKNGKEMKTLAKTLSRSIFLDKNCKKDFFYVLKILLCSNIRQEGYKACKLLKKIISIFDEEESTSIIVSEITELLFIFIDSKGSKIRSNSIYLMSKILNFVDFDFEKILKISERLFDKSSVVKKNAIRILSIHQEKKINSKLYIYHLFKDILRYEISNDVRKETLEHIILNKTTYQSVIERIVDIDFSIRKLFYTKILKKIKFKDLEFKQVEFLIEKVFLERNFDYKEEIVDILLFEFNLNNNLEEFLKNYQFKFEEEFLNILFKKIILKPENLPSNLSQSKIFLIHSKYVEISKGREFISLKNLEIFLAHFSKICKQNLTDSKKNLTEQNFENQNLTEQNLTEQNSTNQNLTDSNQNLTDSNQNLITNLFKIIKFYDIFDEKSLKSLKKTIYKILSNQITDKIACESCELIKEYCYDENLLGSILKIKMQQSVNQTMLLSKYIIKNIIIESELNHILIKEYVMNNQDHELFFEILLYYTINFNDQYIEMFKNCNNLDILFDISQIKSENETIKEITQNIINYIITSNNIIYPKSLSKFYLTNEFTKNDILITLLSNYYNLEYSDLDNQHLFVFFSNVFNNNVNCLVNIFIETFIKIKNQKNFITQSMFWMIKEDTINKIDLFYKIAIFLINNDLNEYKSLLNVLEKLEFNVNINSYKTKKIIYCLNNILRKYPKNKKLAIIYANINQLDDGEPLNTDEINTLQNEIKNYEQKYTEK